MKRKLSCNRRSAIWSFIIIHAILISTPAWSIGVIGKIRVKIDGFQGWHQLREDDLQIRFSSIPGHTRKAGAFKIDDIGVFGRGLVNGTRAVFADDDNNYVKFLVGKSKIVLPVEWQGRVVDDYLVLDPVKCEVFANGMGGCTPAESDEYYESQLKLQVGLPAVQHMPAKPKIVGPAVPVQPTRFVEKSPELKVPPAVAEPLKPVVPVQPQKPNKPARVPDKELELDIVEPLD